MRRHSQPKRPTAADPTSEVDLKLVKELERQSIDEIRKLRSHERMDFRIQVEIRPGNASQAHVEPIMATTSDLSAGGCGAVAPRPLAVGDIYRLEFESGQVDATQVFARCLRCRLLREDAFEIALSFFNAITINRSEDPAGDDLL